MANMSYCRFENTVGDLRDCKDALEELLNGETGPLSKYELPKAKQLIRLCRDVLLLVAENESIEGLDTDVLDGTELDNAIDAALEDAQSAAIEYEQEQEDN